MASYTLSKAHTIAETVHDDIEKSFPKVKAYNGACKSSGCVNA